MGDIHGVYFNCMKLASKKSSIVSRESKVAWKDIVSLLYEYILDGLPPAESDAT